MTPILLAIFIAASFSVMAVCAATAAASVGQPAPVFALNDTNGKAVNRGDFKGKPVVLAWHNAECPFVQKHYNWANMQELQSRYTKVGVVWLAVSSTGPAHPDYNKPSVVNALLKSSYASSTAYLMDECGTTGKAYGASTTPHMHIINAQGTLVYGGGIDDKRSTNIADIKLAKNDLAAALDELTAGKAVSIATSAPCGCSVKYKP